MVIAKGALVEIDEIITFLRDNPYTIGGIASGAGAIGSFIAGWLTSKRRSDIEAAKEHFKELKDHVVSPLISFLGGRIGDFPSWDDVVSKGLPTRIETVGNSMRYKPGVDPILLHDLGENHYPWIRETWNELRNIRSDYLTKESEFDNFIFSKIEKVLKEKHLPYEVLTSSKKEVIFLKQFAAEVRLIMTENRFQDQKIHYDANSTSLNLLNIIYYYSSVPADASGLTETLQSIVEQMKLDEQNKLQTAELIDLKARRDQKHHKLKSDLGIILRKTNLRLEKKMLKVKCIFVKSN